MDPNYNGWIGFSFRDVEGDEDVATIHWSTVCVCVYVSLSIYHRKNVLYQRYLQNVLPRSGGGC